MTDTTDQPRAAEASDINIGAREMAFDNDKATNAERVEFLNSKNAMVEDHGDGEDDPDWMLFYEGANGNNKAMALDAFNYEDALFEACNFLKDA